MKTIPCERRDGTSFTIHDEFPPNAVNEYSGDEECDKCDAQCQVKERRYEEKLSTFIMNKPAWM